MPKYPSNRDDFNVDQKLEMYAAHKYAFDLRYLVGGHDNWSPADWVRYIDRHGRWLPYS